MEENALFPESNAETVAGAGLTTLIGDVVSRIVAAVHPLRIILFGSAAQGRMGPDSDLDLLVVMPDGTHRRRTSQTLFRALQEIDVPKDIVVVTDQD
ncbi:MAG: nucleotidyltransferase domain-containing protein, partial [Magnetococcales bacterium]|nr:nucleotidyltransferase domain-containing protein [Magnetococcales bacterium]